MNAIREAAFDKLAPQYDAVWSDTPVGKAQRSAVWSWVDPLFKKGDFVLDLGCGTGVDALHLQSRGISVYGIDSSPKMVEVARRRGIEADCCPIERLRFFDLDLDGVISNFGALNCLTSLCTIAGALGRMVRSGGHLALCFMSPVCLWEIAFYLSHGRVAKAFRRLCGRANSSIGTDVFYPSGRAIVSAFQRDFHLLGFFGIGISVPPSYVTFLTDWEVEQLSALDRRLAHRPIFRSLADHRLYIFKRI
ncbi:MAG: methyltransferase domain-containing protein [Acidobacteriaceae bacterium]|nr:methyltransferase domain-containing protein [Acidobacteriaceae bacterium]